MSTNILLKALQLFEDPYPTISKCLMVDAMSVGNEEKNKKKRKKKRKKHRSIVEILRTKQLINRLERNLQAIKKFSAKRKAAQEPVNEIIKNTQHSRKPFIYGNKHNAKKRKQKTKKAVFDDRDFENFFKDYQVS